MKTINFIFFFLLISSSLIAQKINIDITFYTKNLEAYEGTWVYQSNDTIFKIVLQNGPKIYKGGSIDGLLGGYFLSVKEDTLENHLSPLPKYWKTFTTTNNLYIWATNYSDDERRVDPNSLRFTFWDQKKRHYNGNGIMAGTINLLSPNKIRWILDEVAGIRATIDPPL
jgi:hypothetical protein